ncbi:S8 family serine peptidase [Vampirovibrio chlorellavorus]|uniref:S8 family serine peptidase n=1 Tax=Vampirovibrio chlorellavorus TaxID=758823 RepID=UPI0026EA41B8|nr:S8 family serine peptidase [Vampirovibrio chlorellavorus]
MASNGLNLWANPNGAVSGTYPNPWGGSSPKTSAYGSQPSIEDIFPFGGNPLLSEGSAGQAGALAQLLQSLLGNAEGLPFQPPQASAKNRGSAVIVEVGYTGDGKADEHAQSVMEVYRRYNPNGAAALEGINDTAQDGPASTRAKSAPAAPKLNSQQALDELIDTGATDALNVFSREIDQVVRDGKGTVINGSLGFSRNELYIDTLHALQANPALAQYVGLKPSDIQNLDVNKDGVTTVTEPVANAISTYVDNRLDAPDSAFQQARARYQASTRNAAQSGVAVVVAAGNEHALNEVFPRATPGGDTNFLAQSADVISVAASDDQNTPQLQDDTIGSFSSWGDGAYNPTIATDGVGVETQFGPQDGTSFAAPKVAAIIARMQQQNPNLSVAQLKAILQQTAVDTQADPLAEGAGILNPEAALYASAPSPFPMAAGYY